MESCQLQVHWRSCYIAYDSCNQTYEPKQTLISIVCLIASTSANITAIISNVTTTPVDIEVDRFPFIINIEFIATVNQKRKNSIFY